MDKLPVIVGFGGISPAGRSSFHHGYRRLVIDKMGRDIADKTYFDLAVMTGVLSFKSGDFYDQFGSKVSNPSQVSSCKEAILNKTLIRKIENEHFDIDKLFFQKPATLAPNGDAISFLAKKDDLPLTIPTQWHIKPAGDQLVEVSVFDNFDIIVKHQRSAKVRSAGQLPSGIDFDRYYNSAMHPRGLQMSVFAASDAVQSVGIDWAELYGMVSPDKISIYASSVYGQADEKGFGGMFAAWPTGKEVNSKQIALGLSSMPADFVSSYVLGNVGNTAAHQGACATFLYNLEHAIQDIKSGKARIAVVGASEAPITPEIIEGFRSAGALSEAAEQIVKDRLEVGAEPDHRRSSRPFDASNCGFTVGESAQFIVLMDDALAVESGATIYGSAPEVFINADGNKKSIFSPGLGNYICFAKAVAAGQKILGDEDLRHKTFVQAHGTSTPLNRKTESHVLNSVAEVFGIQNWPVSAVKSYLGHTIASAAGDQLMSTLGVWDQGWIPGINTLTQLAEDVHCSQLNFSSEHVEVGRDKMQAAFLNSKGFGGNNATALILSPDKTRSMLHKRYGKQAMTDYQSANERVAMQAADYNQQALQGESRALYHFGENVLSGEELSMTQESVSIPGYSQSIPLGQGGRYSDMCD